MTVSVALITLTVIFDDGKNVNRSILFLARHTANVYRSEKLFRKMKVSLFQRLLWLMDVKPLTQYLADKT